MESGAGDGVEVFLGALDVVGAVDVFEGFAFSEGGGGRGCFHFVEGAEGFGARGGGAVVVAVNDVAAVGVFLDLPLGVDVAGVGVGGIVGNEGENVVGGVVTADEGCGALGQDSDFAAEVAVAFEVDGVFVGDEAVGRDGAEVVAVDGLTQGGLRAGMDWDHDGGGRGGIEHAEDPDGQETGVLFPWLLSSVGEAVEGFDGDHFDVFDRGDAELFPDGFRREKTDVTGQGDVEEGATGIGDGESAVELDVILFAVDDLEWLGVDGWGREPMFEIEGGAFFEEKAELAALGSEPDPVFAADGVDVLFGFAGTDEFTIDPAEAEAGGAVRGAGHDAALISGDDGGLGGAGFVGEEDGFFVRAEEGEVFGEGGGGGVRGEEAGREDEEEKERPESGERNLQSGSARNASCGDAGGDEKAKEGEKLEGMAHRG